METLILVIHIFVSIALIAFILLQSGKGGGVSAAFGGGAGSALGQRSAGTVLSKVTVVLSIIFGVTSMWLAIISTKDQTLATMDAPTQSAPVNNENAKPTPNAADPANTGASSADGTAPAPANTGTTAPEPKPSTPTAPAQE